MLDIYKTKKPPKPAVKVFPDGREVCSDTKAGRDEYQRRKRVMFDRQKGICCLKDHDPLCPGKMRFVESTFEHENGRGGGKRDDRVEVNGKPINGCSHAWCNSRKGSKRIMFNDVP